VCAALSTFFATGLLIAIKLGLVLNLITTLAVLIPGMVFATMAISISMGWIFIALGRYKSQPRWVYPAAGLMLITMLELLVLTYLADAAGKIQ
jgi:hypothetical protein